MQLKERQDTISLNCLTAAYLDTVEDLCTSAHHENKAGIDKILYLHDSRYKISNIGTTLSHATNRL